MFIDFLLASAHHLLVFTIVASLAAELVLVRGPLDKATIRRLGIFDGIYGGSAGLIIVIGILRLLFGLKGWEFYVANHAFWTKMALFLAVGLLSIVPTMRFMRWRKAVEADSNFAVPAAEISSVRRMLHLEALLLFLIPVVAAAMARGMG
jgi:putative membrane protein